MVGYDGWACKCRVRNAIVFDYITPEGPKDRGPRTKGPDPDCQYAWTRCELSECLLYLCALNKRQDTDITPQREKWCRWWWLYWMCTVPPNSYCKLSSQPQLFLHTGKRSDRESFNTFRNWTRWGLDSDIRMQPMSSSLFARELYYLACYYLPVRDNESLGKGKGQGWNRQSTLVLKSIYWLKSVDKGKSI